MVKKYRQKFCHFLFVISLTYTQRADNIIYSITITLFYWKYFSLKSGFPLKTCGNDEKADTIYAVFNNFSE